MTLLLAQHFSSGCRISSSIRPAVVAPVHTPSPILPVQQCGRLVLSNMRLFYLTWQAGRRGTFYVMFHFWVTHLGSFWLYLNSEVRMSLLVYLFTHISNDVTFSVTFPLVHSPVPVSFLSGVTSCLLYISEPSIPHSYAPLHSVFDTFTRPNIYEYHPSTLRGLKFIWNVHIFS